jgi:hypothetical protein
MEPDYFRKVARSAQTQYAREQVDEPDLEYWDDYQEEFIR